MNKAGGKAIGAALALVHRARSEGARLGSPRVLARVGWVGEMDARCGDHPHRSPYHLFFILLGLQSSPALVSISRILMLLALLTRGRTEERNRKRFVRS